MELNFKEWDSIKQYKSKGGLDKGHKKIVLFCVRLCLFMFTNNIRFVFGCMRFVCVVQVLDGPHFSRIPAFHRKLE